MGTDYSDPEPLSSLGLTSDEMAKPEPAPTTPVKRRDHDPAVRPFSDLSSDVTGLLWLVNRVVFHPRGYALALHREDDGSVSGWSMLGDGSEVWTFSEEADDECFAKVADYFAGPHSASYPAPVDVEETG